MKNSDLSKEEILRLARERIFRYAASRVRGDVADDIAQAAMIILIKKYSDKESVDEILKISMGITKLLLQSYYRTGKIDTVDVESANIEDYSPNPEQEARFRQLQSRIMQAVEELGGRCRQLFLLKLDGYSFTEIKVKMGANSIDTVYTWDLRCKKDLNKLLAREGART